MVLGLDLSRRDVACILAEDDGTGVLALRAPLPPHADSLQQWRTLIDTAQETVIRSMRPREQIRAAVLALPFVLDEHGQIVKSLASEGWAGLDLRAGLRDNLQVADAQIVHRVVAEGAGEARFGALKDTSSTRSLFVHLGASLSAAFFDSRGWRDVDIGEIVIEREGSVGSRGRRGTLEAYCAEENFLARAASYGITLRQEREMWEMAKSNFAAQSLRDDFVRRLNHGLGVAWTVLQPQKIVLGGSLAVALGEELLNSIRRGIHEFCALTDETSIVNGALGHDAAVLGAVALAGEYGES